MRVIATLSTCGALAATSLLSADFVGFESDGWYGMNLDGTTGAVGSTDYVVIDVYAQFLGGMQNRCARRKTSPPPRWREHHEQFSF